MVLLKASGSRPVLVAWDVARGRCMWAGSPFFSDRQQPVVPGAAWHDLARYYARTLSWLGARSSVKAPRFTDSVAQLNLDVDYNKAVSSVPAGLFSVDGAQDCPGLSPLEGKALASFTDLHPGGGFSHVAADCEARPGNFDFAAADRQIKDVRRLGLEPAAMFSVSDVPAAHGIWTGASASSPSPAVIKAFADEIAAFLEHVDGKPGPGYRVRVRYVEIANGGAGEPSSVDGYCRLFFAAARRIHSDFPAVRIGGAPGPGVPAIDQFVDECGPEIDWIAWQAQDCPAEIAFQAQDDVQAHAKKRGLAPFQFLVTAWDFDNHGRSKFDYMMKRYFQALGRRDLLGALHPALGSYGDPGSHPGLLEPDRPNASDKKGDPIHEAYDALWSFRDFRGERVSVQTSAQPPSPPGAPGFAQHVQADAAHLGDRLAVVMYSDWAYDGSGYRDDIKGLSYPKTHVQLNLVFPPSSRARTLSIAEATGEGFTTVERNIPIPIGSRSLSRAIDLTPMTAVSITVDAAPPPPPPF